MEFQTTFARVPIFRSRGSDFLELPFELAHAHIFAGSGVISRNIECRRCHSIWIKRSHSTNLGAQYVSITNHDWIVYLCHESRWHFSDTKLNYSSKSRSSVIKAHTGGVRRVAFSADSCSLLSASDDKTIKVRKKKISFGSPNIFVNRRLNRFGVLLDKNSGKL